MIQSMTGYGRAELAKNGKMIKAEIRSLNSKFLDLNLRLPFSLKDKEIEVRNLLTEKLQRGKVDVSITIENGIAERDISLNMDLVIKYYQELKSLAQDLGAENHNLLAIVMQMPEVRAAKKPEILDEEWIPILEVLQTAISDLSGFREKEGAGLEQMFRENINLILGLLNESETFENERMELIKLKLRNQLLDLVSSEEYDRNRFEQELIYYLERMDFTEEKVRLRSHCDYFLKVASESDSNGRKLSFISQEIGREINTLGSKANHAGIQKLVVQMKDELEKIKEQLLNVL